jgi:hypothetical protein
MGDVGQALIIVAVLSFCCLFSKAQFVEDVVPTDPPAPIEVQPFVP